MVFDKDNTLTLPYDFQLHPPLKQAIDEARTVFGNNLAVLSNSVGSSDDRNFEQAKRLEESLALKVIRHGTKVLLLSLFSIYEWICIKCFAKKFAFCHRLIFLTLSPPMHLVSS